MKKELKGKMDDAVKGLEDLPKTPYGIAKKMCTGANSVAAKAAGLEDTCSKAKGIYTDIRKLMTETAACDEKGIWITKPRLMHWS